MAINSAFKSTTKQHSGFVLYTQKCRTEDSLAEKLKRNESAEMNETAQQMLSDVVF